MKFRIFKPKTSMIILLIMGLPVFIPISAFFGGDIGSGLFLLLGWCFSFGVIVEQHLVRHIEINAEGVRCRSLLTSYHMSWEEIKIIGIGYMPLKVPRWRPWLYFAADGKLHTTFFGGDGSSKLFMVVYREEIVKVIKEYWKGDINGLNDINKF